MTVLIRGVKTAVRYFTSSSHIFSQIYTRTTLNPVSFKLTKPPNFEARSVLLLSTPSILSQIIEESIDAYQKQNLQVVVAGVDTVIPNSQRNGVSEMWLDEYFHINSSVLLEERDDLNTLPIESDGINIVTGKKNWKNIKSNLEINLAKNSKIDLKLSNTVFSTGNLVTLFYFQPNKDQTSGQTLCDLSISLPSGIFKNELNVESSDKWIPLYDSLSEPLIITSCAGNLAKLINNKSAAGYLENNKKLMSLGSKDTEVYVKVYKRNSTNPQKFKVVAGGGGWGAKANILALSPEAKLSKGDRIEFFMLTPDDRFSRALSEIDLDEVTNKLMFECSYEEQSYNAVSANNESVLENTFGGGSEKGFKYNNVQYASAGERLAITI